MKKVVKALFIAGLMFGSASSALADIKLGILANRGELETTTRWADFGKYLSQAAGEPVQVVPLPPAKVAQAVTSGEVNMVLSHSPHTVYAVEKAQGRVLATLNTEAGPNFGGVIVAKKGSGISKAADLKGKRVMSLKFKQAAGAYIFQTHYLLKQGIDPHRDFASITEGKKQDDLVLAVNSGLIDAAFIRTGLLEEMEAEKKIKKDDFVVVDAKTQAGFPLALSTDLYPEWCLTALPGVSAEAADKVKAAAMKLDANNAAAKAANIRGFVDAQSLDGIKDALQRLKIAPYDA